MMGLLLLNNLDKIEKKKKATNLLCTVTRYGPQSVASASGVNLLRWNDVSRTSRIFCPELRHFLSFKYILSITQNK